MDADRRTHLIALPLALAGVAVGTMLVWFDPVSIAQRHTTASIARDVSIIKPVPQPLAVPLTKEEIARARTLTPLPAAPDDPTNSAAGDGRAARLGQALFFDTRLSGNGSISCASCHDPRRHFADGHALSEGIGRGDRNVPTLINVAHQRWLTWDGRADSVWAQALDPLEGPLEMGGNRVAVVRLISRDNAYRTWYERIFRPLPPLDTNRIGGPRIPEAAKPMPEAPDDPLNESWIAMRELDRERVNRVFANVGKALAAYQRRLVDNDSPFDLFIAGLDASGTTTTSPLDASELRGLKLFVGKANCISCHHGPMLSDGEFHNIGVPEAGGQLPHDPGRRDGIDVLKHSDFRAAGLYSDAPDSEVAVISEALINSPENWGRFRTPSLRDVAVTGPYMHAGQLDTLEDVVRFYSTLEGAVQLDHHRERLLTPLQLTEEEIGDLVAFLGTLTGTGPTEDLCSPTSSADLWRSIDGH